jgi:hypothetical protein
MSRSVAPLAVALLLASGCGAPDGGTFTVTDSSGVRIARSTGPAWGEGEGWRVAGQPTVSIGVAEGEPAYELAQVTGATRLSDGTIVVANRVSNELRYFDASGRYVTSVGRTGGGPGEFQWLQRVRRLEDDTVLAWDQRTKRLSWFDGKGNFIRSVLMRGGTTGTPTPGDRFADGRFLGTSTRLPPQWEGHVKWTPVYVRFSAEGLADDTIMERPHQGTEMFFVPVDTLFAPIEVPFGRTQAHVARGDRLYVLDGALPRIEVFDTAGRLVSVITADIPPRAVTPADLDRYRAETLERTRDANAKRRFETAFAELPVPPNMPAFSELRIDPSGHIWAQRYRAFDDEPQSWTVFDPEGRMLGDVVLPTGLEVYDIGDDYILGKIADDLGVEQVRVHEVQRGGG